METILWINACMRGPEQSRTWRLCRTFLEEYRAAHPVARLVERDLTRGDQPVMTAQLAKQRDELARGEADDPLLIPARELAQADLIVVGAPYWDMAFPAALKVYLEWACTLGLTFRYSEKGELIGLCSASKLVYITTAGGDVEGRNFGYDYVKGVAEMLGIRDTVCVAAARLDVWGTDVEAALGKAEEKLRELARE